MRTLVPAIVCLMICSMTVKGQNYQTVYPDVESCFVMEGEKIVCLRIDSLSGENNSVLHPSRVHLLSSEECYAPLDGSWIGKKIEIHDSGENVFINRFDRPVTINTHAALGDQWVAYEVPDELQIEATVVAHDIMDFLELADSVKTIAFQAYNAHGDSLELAVNEMQAQLSKHYGWVRPLNFYHFPMHHASHGELSVQELLLTGLSEPQVGVQNLTWFEVHDFQPGDVLHVLEEDGDWVYTGPEEGYFQITETRSVFEYLDRTNHGDSITYDYVLTQRIHIQGTGQVTATHDTLTKIVNTRPDFDHFPYTAVPFYEGGEVSEEYSYYTLGQGTFFYKADPFVIFSNEQNQCWQPLSSWRVPFVKYYYQGLGGPYYPRETMNEKLVKRMLAYYEKDGESWGTPLDVSGISPDHQPEWVKIYPNPARESITLSIEPSHAEKLSVRLVDVNSRVVHQQKVSSGTSVIHIEHLPPGVYFCVVFNKDRVLHSHKLVVQ